MSVDMCKGKWRARISVNGKRTELGRFDTEAEARSVYAAALERHGPERKRRQKAFADPRERFAAKCSTQPNGCVLWTGAKDKDGYGKFQLNEPGKQTHVRAHRYAYFLAHGVWPSELVLHSCDTPACVEASHLSDGSQSENLIQCAVRGRRKSVRLTVGLVASIRARHQSGERPTDIAASLGLPRPTIYGVIHRRTWRHVS